MLAAVRERRRTGAWRLPPFATNGDRRLFKKITCVLELMEELPPTAERAMLGERAADQTSKREREALVMRLIESRAGPEGELARKALRALRLLRERAQRRGLPDGG